MGRDLVSMYTESWKVLLSISIQQFLFKTLWRFSIKLYYYIESCDLDLYFEEFPHLPSYMLCAYDVYYFRSFRVHLHG